MYSQRGPSFSNMVSLNLSIPLQLDQPNRQDRELAAKTALAEQARARREEAEREMRAEVLGWLQEWQSNRERLDRYDRTVIPLASERVRAALSSYRGAGGSLDSVLAARRMEIDTRIERLRLEMETAGLWARLAFLVPSDHGAAAPDRSSPDTGR